MGVAGERLQKVLANQGLASRRQIEQWIQQGRIKINGKVAELGCRVTPKDRILVDGKAVRLQQRSQQTRVLLYHKPAGVMCTRDDPEGRPTVFEKLPPLHGQRWVMVGRLDYHTAGVLLFTNDGPLANQLMHPAGDIEREYAVRIFGELTSQQRQWLLSGVQLSDGMAKFESIRNAGGEAKNHWYHVILKEGRNREVRRLFESQHLTVSRLIRVRFGPIQLPRDLRQGQCRQLTSVEYKQLTKTLKPNKSSP